MTEVKSDFLLKFILVAVILLVVSVYFYFFSFLSSSYSPYYGDEYFYFKNSESFYLSNTLKAAFTYSGNGAKILGADAHGPAYPILYGSLSKVFGWGGLTIPLVNIGILVLALLFLIWNKREPRGNRSLQLLLILGSPITLFYSITYMPELLHIAGGIGLFLLMQRYIENYRREDFFILLLYIFILGSIRSTWFFAFFGLIVLPGPIRGFAKSGYLFLGLALAFLSQHFLHEQVPNTFSGLGEIFTKKGPIAVLEAIYLNLKRNVYYSLTYTEGYFYTAQKFWILCTLLVSMASYRKSKLIQYGLIILCSLIAFNLIIYRNYGWVEFRILCSATIFLNLALISTLNFRIYVKALILLNLLSFVLILPFQSKMIQYRKAPSVLGIPINIIHQLKKLDGPLIYVDSVLLEEYLITDLPLSTKQGEPIRYILPYYPMPMKSPNLILSEEDGQLNVKPVKILNQ